MSQIKRTFQLDSKGVDQASAMLQERMQEKNLKKENILRTRLAFESILFDLSAHYDGKNDITLIMKKRLGIRTLTLVYKGDSFNPLRDENSVDELAERFLADISMKPTWRYKNNTNEINIRVPRNRLRDDIKLLIAILIAVIFGFAGAYLPPGVAGTAMEYVFRPISDVFMNMLKAFAGVLIFLSIITGICGVGNVSDFSKIGKHLIGRYILITFLGTIFCTLAMLPLHKLTFGVAQGSAQGKKLFQMVLDIVPSNPITPFIDCNLLQIVFLAILIGVAILVLQGESSELQAVLIQAKNAMMYVIDILCRLLPFYILASLTILFWENGMGIFRSIWKPLLLVVIFLHLMALIKVAIVAIKFRISPILLLKKCATSYLIGLSTASSMMALSSMLDANENRFGIPKNLSEFGVPIGNTIGRHMVGGGFVAVMLFLAEYADVTISIGWLIGLCIYIPIVSFAMPPISGGVLICLGVMLAQFGIPSELLGLAAPLTLLSDFVMAGAYIIDEHMEMILQAKHWNTLNEDILRSDDY